MPSETAKNYLKNLLAQAFNELKIGQELNFQPQILVPEPQFGDYSTNAALVLAKVLKQKPQEVAEKFIAILKELDAQKVFSEIKPAGGFVNFSLSAYSLLENLNLVLNQKENFGFRHSEKQVKVVFEYSSPNTNKPLHIGHVRNDTYGQCCIRLLRSQGYEVISCEVINDRGIHIMKSMLMYIKYGKGKTPESEKIKPDHFVGKFYAMFGEYSSKDENTEKQLLEEAQGLLKEWENGNPEVRSLWAQMNSWWSEGVKETYAREGSVFDEVDYESEIFNQGRELVLEGLKRGIFQKEEDGSVFVDLTNEGLDKKYLLRKDGTTIYITQDLYLWYLRNERHHPNAAIVTTATEQSYHFAVLSHLFKKLGFGWAENFKHLPYEHVYLGKNKMSSRGGNTVTADELLEMVKNKIVSVMEASEKIKASSENGNLVEKIALGAIKYGYLKFEPNTRIYFDLESTISVEGNTGPYIQYANARIRSILKQIKNISSVREIKLEQGLEIDLLRKLVHFPEAVELSAKEYKPNLLCNYLYELAHTFNGFYAISPVVQEKDEYLKNLRANIIMAVSQVLNNGLGLLGIEAPEEM